MSKSNGYYYEMAKSLMGEDYEFMRRGDMRSKVIELLGGECSICGSTDPLDIHHIDGDGENNEADNLDLLCRECHLGVTHSTPEIRQYIEENYD